MRKFIQASMKIRFLVSTLIAALVVGIVAITIVINAKSKWHEAVMTYDMYYAGGDKLKCEALFSNFNAPNQERPCEARVPPNGQSMSTKEFLAELDKSANERNECLAERAATRRKSIEALWTSGCPINENRWGWGYSEGTPPTLRIPSDPGTLMRFAWSTSPISAEMLALWFPLIAIFLLLSSVVAATINQESHLGWKRLLITLSILLAPIPLVIFTQDNTPSPEGFVSLLALGLFGSATLLVIARKTTVWILSGFNSNSPIQSFDAPTFKPVGTYDKKVPEKNNDDALSIPIEKNSSYEARAEEGVSNDESRQKLLAMPLASPWRRLIARTIDMWLLSLPIAIIGVIFLGASISEHEYIYGFALIPFVMLLEAAISATLGNSPGKMLLALRLTNIGGGALTFRDYYERGIGVYIYGLAFGIPLLCMFPMFKQYNNLNAGRPTSYDQGKYSVRVSDRGILRKILAVIVLFVLASIPGCVSEIIR